MASRYRPRKEYKFWLFHDLSDDARIMEYITYLKSTRQFSSVIRDGIRLIWSLREGNLKVLFELFPHLERQFNPDAEDLIAQFRDMLLSNRQLIPVQSVAIEPVGEGDTGNKLASKQIALPTFVDDDDAGATIVLNRSTGSTSNSQNLMAGIFGLE